MASYRSTITDSACAFDNDERKKLIQYKWVEYDLVHIQIKLSISEKDLRIEEVLHKIWRWILIDSFP